MRAICSPASPAATASNAVARLRALSPAPLQRAYVCGVDVACGSALTMRDSIFEQPALWFHSFPRMSTLAVPVLHFALVMSHDTGDVHLAACGPVVQLLLVVAGPNAPHEIVWLPLVLRTQTGHSRRTAPGANAWVLSGELGVAQATSAHPASQHGTATRSAASAGRLASLLGSSSFWSRIHAVFLLTRPHILAASSAHAQGGPGPVL